MIKLRKAGERGTTELSWLQSRHSFSFGDYYDPANMGFRTLRVINEDRVIAGGGFAPHSHKDMEIITYILAGELEHKDSLGQGSIIRAGDVQRMTAGTGITHSEYNPSKTDPVHFLQIWILPAKTGLQPSYEQKSFASDSKTGELQLVAATEAAGKAVQVHQDVRLYIGHLTPGYKIQHGIDPGRGLWLQVSEGTVKIDGQELSQGDGCSVLDQANLEIQADKNSRILLFDLA
jgi:redox-sensitive bicupin YhaK (pirin superfamily)